MAAPLLKIRLKPSARLGAMLGLAHLAAIAMLWPLVLPLTVKFLATAALIASLIFYWKRYVSLNASPSVTGFELSEDMACVMETHGGERIHTVLLGSSFVAPYLTVLNWKFRPCSLGASWRHFSASSVVIMPDGIDAEEFRQLRILLKWKWKETGSRP
jgi:toxin CptA